jgi:hypothetical protein
MVMQGGSDTTDPYNGGGGTTIIEGPGPTVPRNNSGPNVAPPPPPSTPFTQQTQSQPVAAYTVTTSPNPSSAVGTVGLVPKQAVDPRGAAALAAGVSQRLNGKWKSLHIYVFADAQTATSFNSVVRSNGGRPSERTGLSTAAWSLVKHISKSGSFEW